jgi:hypothetical protein
MEIDWKILKLLVCKNGPKQFKKFACTCLELFKLHANITPKEDFFTLRF